MKTLAIFGKTSASANWPFVALFIQQLQQAGLTVLLFDALKQLVEKEFPHTPFTYFTSETNLAPAEAIISIGGDGTLLECATLALKANLPVLGINTGRLGFLTECSKDEAESLIPLLVNNQLVPDSRTLLAIDSTSAKFNPYPFALNEVTVHKSNSTSMVTINVFADGSLLNTYWADGLIIATPTGSTAYSLSCGGPILTPDSPNLIITPIAPHNLNIRPLVIPNTTKLEIAVEARTDDFIASLDSRAQNLHTSTKLTISLHPQTLTLLRRPSYSFLQTLRQKLLWGSDKRN